MKRVYMDFAAATPLDPRVVRAMHQAEKVYGNPSAPHAEGRRSRELIEGARVRIARVLEVKADELIFTASGTESNNLAVRGLKARHIVTSSFEHPSIANALTKAPAYAAPNKDGVVTAEEVVRQVRPDTDLISIALVQGEIGIIQPLKEISRAVKAKNPHTLIHADCSQAPLWMDASPHVHGLDLATYDAQKINGPKGVGLLWRTGMTDIEPLIRGGKQERGVRPGTENTTAIVGMARAFELAKEGRVARANKVETVRDYFVELVKTEVSEAEINGSMKHRIANNINISIPGVDGDYLAVLLDARGVAVSPRSACIASGTPSSSITALGKGESAARGTLRFTLSPSATRADARRAVAALKGALEVAFRKGY